MGPIVGAALFGAVVGVGAELSTNFEKRGSHFVTSLVAVVALRVIATVFGWGAAVGVFLGALEGRVHSLHQAVGMTTLGGCAGYFLENVFRLMLAV